MTSIKVENLDVGYSISRKVLGGISFLPSEQLITALSDISFSLEKGDKLAIIGPNGGGKSTLLKVLAESLPPQKGNLEIHGEKLSILNRGYGLMPFASLKENAKLKAFSMGLAGQKVIDFVQDCIELAELVDKADHPLKTLSTGMQGRFNLALNTQLVKEIMILDEWVGELEANQSRDGGLLTKLIDEAHIIVLASHNQSIVRKLCNKVLLLDEGHLKYFGDDFDFAFDELAMLKGHNLKDEQVLSKSKQKKTIIHILNPRKTARYLVKKVLQECNKELFDVILHDQKTSVNDIPEGEKIIVFGRHPYERFARIFYGRLNSGKPYYNNPRSNVENNIFEEYPTPNDLLESMGSVDETIRVSAYLAFAHLQIKSDYLSEYLFCGTDSERKKKDIVSYASFDEPEKTINNLLRELKIDSSYQLLFDEEEKRYFKKKYSEELSAASCNQLDMLYSKDIKIYRELFDFQGVY